MDSDTVEIPDPLLFLVAIQNIGLRYGLGQDVDERVLKQALLLVSDQAKLALTLMKVPKERQDELQDEWDDKRINLATPRYLRDPMLNAMREFVSHIQISIRDYWPIPGSQTAYHFDFEYHCEDCGGYEIHIPEPTEDASLVTCTACGRPFGTYIAIKTLCEWMGRQEMRRRKLGGFADPDALPELTLTVHGRPPR